MEILIGAIVLFALLKIIGKALGSVAGCLVVLVLLAGLLVFSMSGVVPTNVVP